MTRAALGCAWAASIAPFVLEALPVDSPFDGASASGLALLPWVALAGLPVHTGPSSLADALRRAALWIGVALPPVFVGVALDRSRGQLSDLELLWGVGAALICVACLAAASAGAGGRRRTGVGLGLVWLALVPAPAAFLVGTRWAPRLQGEAESAVSSSIEWANPLAWVHGWTRAEGALAPDAWGAVGPCVTVGLFVAIALVAARAEARP